MKTIFPTILGLLLALATSSVSQPPPPAPAPDYFPDSWKTVSVVDYGFSVKAPRELRKSLVLTGTPDDRSEEVRYSSENPKFISYIVSISDHKKDDLDGELDRILSTRRNIGGNVSKKLTTHLGGAAIDYEWDINGRRTRGFALVRGRKTFLVEFSAPSEGIGLKSENAYREIADAYLQSFAFLSGADILRAEVRASDDTGEWQDYASEDDGFNVKFPGTPTRTETQVQTQLRLVPQVNYSLKTAPVRYLIMVQNYSLDISDKVAIDKLFDDVKAGFVKRGMSAVGERPIAIGESYGREIGFDSPGLSISSRLVFSHGRLYSAMAISEKAQISLPALKNSVDASIDKFLDSFQLSLPKKLREAETSDLMVPKGFFGELTGQSYRNDYFAFRLQAPTGWTASSPESNKMILQAGADLMAVQNPDALAKLRSPEKVLTVFRQKPMGLPGNASLMIDTVRANAPKVDLIASIRNQEKLYGQTTGSRVTVPTTSLKIQGRDFAFFERETQINGTTLRQRILGTTQAEYLLLFILSGTDAENFKAVENAMATLRFLR